MKEFNPLEPFEKNEVKHLKETVPFNYLEQKVILGIDIYKYSQYPLSQQFYVPILFDILYETTVINLIRFEPFIFSKYASTSEDFRKKFISTGDGGFQIFDNPVESIVFALFFQVNIRRFLSGSNELAFMIKLREIIDRIDLRYAITSDLVYKYKSNFYGPGIINNARILSKDALNRLLIDSNTMQWFTININAVENLMDITKDSFLLIKTFNNYDNKLDSILFGEPSFKAVDVQKIGSITVKDSLLDIYNLHIQAILKLMLGKPGYDKFVITLGNLNTSGIE